MNEAPDLPSIAKIILDLGVPVSLVIWFLWRDYKWIQNLRDHSILEIHLLKQIAELLVDLIRDTHGRTPSDK